MAVFRNKSVDTLTVTWNGRLQTVGPDETLEVPDTIANDESTVIEGDRWARVNTPKGK